MSLSYTFWDTLNDEEKLPSEQIPFRAMHKIIFNELVVSDETRRCGHIV